jgi:SAM-dependent methyltransferase
MKNLAAWRPTKYQLHRGRWRGARDAAELGVGSRLMGDLVAACYQAHLSGYARGRLLDLGCGKAPLYGAYSSMVLEGMCVDWAPGDYIDRHCDLSQPLPFEDGRFDTIVLSDVLEHIAEPAQLWREMTRALAPGGHVIMNVPFYYSIHAHPHDYYRYTNFALERFAQLNGLELRVLEAFGGINEVLGDLLAKVLSKLPMIGPPLAIVLQAAAGTFRRTGFGTRIAQVSSRHFPLGYFMIARRPPA